MDEDDSDPYLTTWEAGKFLGISKRTLEGMRGRKTGPAYSRLGDVPNSRIVYRRSTLIAYAEQRKINPIDEEDE